VAELDLLNGSAIGANGGVARHALELEGGYFMNGIGLRVSGNYESGSRVDGGDLPGATDLSFHPIATLNLRAFINFDNRPGLTKAIPFLKGSRLRLAVDNLFDAQQRVTDDAGLVPLRYQPGFIEPRGRFVSLSFRKRF